MKKILTFIKDNFLKIYVSFLIAFIPLYPKLPSVHINHTWVYIRLEDFFILGAALIWGLWFLYTLFRTKKIPIPLKFSLSIFLYWVLGFITLVYSLIFVGPYIANFFPSVAALSYFRRIEYMVLFFVAFSTIKSKKDVKNYLIILGITIFAFSLYAFGQRFYLDLWNAFPKFFEKYSFCFPSFQTGNEQFAKGIPLCLPQGARMTSTFAGSYDLGAYLVMVIPIFIAVIFAVKKRLNKFLAFILVLASIMVVIFTSSRISFVAYLTGITLTLFLIGKKRFIIPFYILSLILLLAFSGSTAKRFLETFRLVSVVTNNQGQVVGTASLPTDLKNKIASNATILANTPTQNLPAGTGYLGLPQLTAPQSTTSAVVSSNLSVAEAKRLKLENGGVEISTISGTFLVRQVLVYDISFTTRFQGEWPVAWGAFLRNPLFGSGFSTITLAADNDYLRALGEAGLLGLLSFIFIFLLFFIALRETIPKIDDPFSKALLLGLAGGIFGLSLNAVLIDVFEASKLAESFWILLGIAMGIIYLYKKEFSFVKHLKTIFLSRVAFVVYLLFLSFVYFLNTINNFFVADDFTWLHWAASSTLSSVPKYFLNSQGFFYRPLDKSVMFFLYTLFSFQPYGYHLFALLVHFLIAVGVFLLANRIFKNRIFAFLGAFIFLFLPSQGEDILWIATISTNLSALFIVYLLLFWLSFREKSSYLYYTLSIIFALFAFLSYEGSIVILPLLILFDICLAKVKLLNKNIWISYIPFILMTIIYPFVRIFAKSVSFGGDYSYSLIHLVPNVVGNFLGYFALFIFGEPSLSYYTLARTLLKQEQLFVAAFLVLLVIVLFGVLFLTRQRFNKLYTNEKVRLGAFFVSFSFISLIPYLGLGNIAERYGYLASVGFSILLVYVLINVLNLVKKGKFTTYILILIVALLGVWYYVQLNSENLEWRSAGKITNRTLSYLRLYYEGIPDGSSLYFVNVPIRKDQAWIFPVGLTDGIWFIYRDPTLKVYEVPTLQKAKELAGSAKNSYIFVFDKEGIINAN